MKPEEIAPHVGKGKRLVTLRCDEVGEGQRGPFPSFYVHVHGLVGARPVPASAFHSIRPVGEACEWRMASKYDREWNTECGRHFLNPLRPGDTCLCGKPIKEVGGPMKPEEMGQVDKSATCACSHCGSQTDLMMFPHRTDSPGGPIIGLLFVCPHCRPMVAANNIRIHYRIEKARKEAGDG